MMVTEVYTNFLTLPKMIKQLWGVLPKSIRNAISETIENHQEYALYTKDAKERICQLKQQVHTDDIYASWLKAYKKYRVSFTEYWDQYHFPERIVEEKDAYMSAAEMRSIYRQKVEKTIRTRFTQKDEFLRAFSEYVSRHWLRINPSTTTEEILDFINRFDIIVKPVNGTHGQGVYKLEKGASSAIKDLIGKDFILEQCVSGDLSLQSFHPDSLNTIRIAMFTDGKACVKPMWAVLRTGNNHNCVDNTHGGGISSLIDVGTGIVISDGQSNGTFYETHPVSGKKFRGFQIPYWDQMLAICKKAALKYPNTFFVGWDVAVWSDGNIELIEGNHAPDVDGVQTLLGHGIKPYINNTMKNLGI